MPSVCALHAPFNRSSGWTDEPTSTFMLPFLSGTVLSPTSWWRYIMRSRHVRNLINACQYCRPANQWMSALSLWLGLHACGCGAQTPADHPESNTYTSSQETDDPRLLPFEIEESSSEVSPEETDDQRAQRHGTIFDEVWLAVSERHYDENLRGLDWEMVKTELRPRAVSSENDEEFQSIINQMLSRLGQSHFAFMPGKPHSGAGDQVRFRRWHPGHADSTD